MYSIATLQCAETIRGTSLLMSGSTDPLFGPMPSKIPLCRTICFSVRLLKYESNSLTLQVPTIEGTRAPRALHSKHLEG